MEYRGFSETCYPLIESISGLRALLDVVCHDPDCCVEVRHNYLNCYYRGGSLFRMEFKPRSGQVEFRFDPKYFNLRKAPPTTYEDLRAWNASEPNAPEQWLKRLGELKKVMAAWLEEHRKAERETQQQIVKSNTFAHGDYQSIDIELAIPKDRSAGRMDIIAVRREGARYVPVIVELKHGKAAFDGASGIRNHYDKTTRFLDSPLDGADGERYLAETIHRIWETKRRLGLLEGPVPDAAVFGRAELLFAVTGWDGSADEIRRRLPERLTRTVRVAISPTKELHFDNAAPLDQDTKGGAAWRN